jgi:hypothetical protein
VNRRGLVVACLWPLLTAGMCQTTNPDAGLKPVAVACVPPATPAAPQVHTPEQLRAVPDGPTLFTMAAADYEKLYAWLIQAAPVLEGCRAATAPSAGT